MTDTLIKVENVSKKFCHSLKRSLWYGMQDLGNELIGRRHGGNGELREDEFWAVRNVSLELKRGECLGFVGRNGAGKSTLLKMLNGLIKPDQGRIAIRGRVGALIELGAGFNPTLTGRENIYVNGSVLGFTKAEIDKKFDAILAFADLEKFIDAPVQTYSSGMKVRLGFAIAAQMEPDVLLVDEVLAVGDVGFRIKCLNRIAEMRSLGTCIILVSHDIMLMRNHTDWQIYLEHGHIKSMGDPEMVGEAYIRDNIPHTLSDVRTQPCLPSHSVDRAPSQISHVEVATAGDTVRVHVRAHIAPAVARPEIVVQFRDPQGYVLYGRHATDTDISRPTGSLVHATLELDAKRMAGEYGISLSLNSLAADGTATVLDKQVGIATLQVPIPPDAGFHGSVNLGGKWLRSFPGGANQDGAVL